MKKRNKFIAAISAICILGQTATYAAVPEGTVIIDNKAFSIEGKRDLERTKEILKLLKGVENEVYVNTLQGIMTEYSKETISSKRLPVIEYKDDNGKIKYYEAKNGEEIKFGVEKSVFTSRDKVEISLRTPGNNDELLNKDNYKIGGLALGEKDTVEISEDGKTVKIILANPIENKNINTSIELSKNIKDINGDTLKSNVKNELVIVQEKITENISGKNVVVLGDNITLENIKIEGNVYLQGENIKVKGCEIKGAVTIDSQKDSAIVIEKTKADALNIENRTKKVDLKGAEIDNININSANKATLTILENTKVNMATVLTETEIEQKSGTIENLLVDFSVVEPNKTITLSGVFPKVKAVFDCKILAKKGSKVNVVINTESGADKINLEGYYDKVNVESKAEVNLADGTKVNVISSSVDTEINTGSSVEIGKVEGKVELEGKGQVTGGTPSTPSTGGGGWIGGGSTTPTVNPADTIIKHIASGVIKTWNEYPELKAVATATYADKTATITIADGKENMMIKELYGITGKVDALKKLMNNTTATKTIKLIVEGKDKELLDYAVDVLNIKLDTNKDTLDQIIAAVKGLDETTLKSLVKEEYKRLLANESNSSVNGTNAQIKLCNEDEKEVSKIESIEIGGKYLYGGTGSQLKTIEEIKDALGLEAATPIMQMKLGQLKGKTIKINFTEGKSISIVIK